MTELTDSIVHPDISQLETYVSTLETKLVLQEELISTLTSADAARYHPNDGNGTLINPYRLLWENARSRCADLEALFLANVHNVDLLRRWFPLLKLSEEKVRASVSLKPSPTFRYLQSAITQLPLPPSHLPSTHSMHYLPCLIVEFVLTCQPAITAFTLSQCNAMSLCSTRHHSDPTP